jgi:hypothetical protein
MHRGLPCSGSGLVSSTVLAPVAPRVLAPWGLSHMHKYETKSKGATHEVQHNMMHE